MDAGSEAVGPCAQLNTWDPCLSNISQAESDPQAEDLCREELLGGRRVPRKRQLVLKGLRTRGRSKASRVGRIMVRRSGADSRSNVLVVQSSQFGRGFDCAIEDKASG
eukprot:5241618-Amphidinium_carterae.1